MGIYNKKRVDSALSCPITHLWIDKCQNIFENHLGLIEVFFKEKFTTMQDNALQPLGKEEFYSIIFIATSKLYFEMPIFVCE